MSVSVDEEVRAMARELREAGYNLNRYTEARIRDLYYRHTKATEKNL